MFVGVMLSPLLFWDPTDAVRPVREALFPFENPKVAFAIFAAYSLLIHAWLEEAFWRGVVLAKFGRGTVAVVANGGFFYLMHGLPLQLMLGPSGWLLALPTGAAGAAWAWVTIRSDSLWPAIVSHVAVAAALLVCITVFVL